MTERIYHIDGVVASYPYEFNVYRDGDNVYGEVTARIYKSLQINDEEKEKVNLQLKDVPVQEGSIYQVQDDMLVYITAGPVDPAENMYAADVRIRRHFIEDFIETDLDVYRIVEPFHPVTLKTEFVME